MSDYIFTDRSSEVLSELKSKVNSALESIGNQAVSNAKQNVDEAGRIHTGTMMNSIEHTVVDDSVYIGTNVEYAIYQEMGTSRGITPAHFLKNAVAGHVGDYVKIAQDVLQG